MAYIRTRKRAKLGSMLRGLREQAQLLHDQVAPKLGRDQSRVSRIEGGEAVPTKGEVQIMLALYQASDASRTEVLEAWEDAKAEVSHLEFSSAVPPRFRTYLRAESDAVKVTTLQLVVVPGLLQTPEYARAVEQATMPLHGGNHIDRLIAVKVRRQARLTGPKPLELHALLDEAVIHRTRGLGPPGVLQLEHLLSLGDRPNVTIQVVPFDSGVYGTMAGPVTCLEFENDDDVAEMYLEYPGGGSWVGRKDVPKFAMLLDAVMALALTPKASKTLIAKVARSK